MEMALSLSKNQIHSILSYCAHAIPLLNMENKGLKKRGAKLPLPPNCTLFSIFCQQIEMTSKEFEWMIWEKNIFPETSHKVQPFWEGHKNRQIIFCWQFWGVIVCKVHLFWEGHKDLRHSLYGLAVY